MTKRKQARDRVLETLEKAGPAGVAATELARLTGVPGRTVRHALTKLERLDRIDRLHMGRVRLRAFADEPHVPLATAGGARLWTLLRKADLPAYITGLDVLAPYAQHLVHRFPHIVIADRGAGSEVSYALAEAGFVVVPPGAAATTPDLDTTVIVRERATRLRYGARDNVAPAELAWLDLYREVRAGYPLAPTELGRILQAALGQGATRNRLEWVARDHFGAELQELLEGRSGSDFVARVRAGFRS